MTNELLWRVQMTSEYGGSYTAIVNAPDRDSALLRAGLCAAFNSSLRGQELKLITIVSHPTAREEQ